MSATGFPNFYTEAQNERNLALDDRAAGDFLYPFPETPSKTGSLGGSVEKSGGVPVFGAHVVALREADGAPVSDISVFGGEWRIRRPSRGCLHRLRRAPRWTFRAPDNTLFSGIYAGAAVDQAVPHEIRRRERQPDRLRGAAGSHTSVGTIPVAETAGFLNLTRLGLSDAPTAVIAASAINVYQGSPATSPCTARA